MPETGRKLKNLLRFILVDLLGHPFTVQLVLKPTLTY